MLRRLPHRIAYLLWTPVRLFRQRTMVQLMVSHVAAVLITFVLLNAIALAVILGWLPGRSLIGMEAATQDVFLGERVRSYAIWMDLDEIVAEYGSLESPAARDEIDDRLTRMLDSSVPGFAPNSLVNPSESGYIAFGVPQHAVLTTPDGTVISSTSPELARPGDSAASLEDPAVQIAVGRTVDLVQNSADATTIPYIMQIVGEITGVAAPVYADDGSVLGILGFQGYPYPVIFENARTEIIRDTTLAVVGATWIYMIPAILVALPFAYWQSRSTSRRLERLADLADAFADGDLHTRVRVARHDEIGRLAERFNEMGGRIEEETKVRRAFLSNVSHELRTPVAIIQGTLERIQNKRTESPRQMEQAIALMDLETRNLTRLIDDLSTLGRLEEAKLRLELQPVDVHAVADEAVSGLRQMAWSQRKVSVENLVPDDIPFAFCDPGRLRQVIHNLLFNALRHTPEGGLVVVQAGVSGDAMELAVSDTGVGIPPEKLERVFTRYYQAEIHRRVREGSGLGLHIVQQLVEAQGGTISVESQVGQGTTFRFTVPLSTGGASRAGLRAARGAM